MFDGLCRILSEAQIRQNERRLDTRKRQHAVVVRFVKEFTRNAEFIKQRSYQELFPIQVNSKSDTVIIEEIKQIADRMIQAPFSTRKGEGFG